MASNPSPRISAYFLVFKMADSSSTASVYSLHVKDESLKGRFYIYLTNAHSFPQLIYLESGNSENTMQAKHRVSKRLLCGAKRI